MSAARAGLFAFQKMKDPDRLKYVTEALSTAPATVVASAQTVMTGKMSEGRMVCQGCKKRPQGHACLRIISYTPEGVVLSPCAKCQYSGRSCRIEVYVDGKDVWLDVTKMDPEQGRFVVELEGPGAVLSGWEQVTHLKLLYADVEKYAPAEILASLITPASAPKPDVLPHPHSDPDPDETEPVAPFPFLHTPKKNAPPSSKPSTPAGPPLSNPRAPITSWEDELRKLYPLDMAMTPAQAKVKETILTNQIWGGRRDLMLFDQKEAKKAEERRKKEVFKKEMKEKKGDAGRVAGGKVKVAAGEESVRVEGEVGEGDEEEEEDDLDLVGPSAAVPPPSSGTGATSNLSPITTTRPSGSTIGPSSAPGTASPPATPSKRAVRIGGEPIANKPRSKPSGRGLPASGAQGVGGTGELAVVAAAASEGEGVPQSDSGLGAATGPVGEERTTSKDRRQGKSSPGRETPTKLSPPEKKRNGLKVVTAKAAEGLKKTWGKGVGGFKDVVSGRRGGERGGARAGVGGDGETLSGMNGTPGSGTRTTTTIADLVPLPDHSTHPVEYEKALVANLKTIFSPSFRPPVGVAFEVQEGGEWRRNEVATGDMAWVRALALQLEGYRGVRNERDVVSREREEEGEGEGEGEGEDGDDAEE